MKLYLDDDSVDKELVKRLRDEGHDIHVPPVAGQRESVHDAEHRANAVGDGRVLLTKNDKDFIPLGRLIVNCGGHHPGILLIREEQERAKKMTIDLVLKAVANVDKNTNDTLDQMITLNDRRTY